MLLNMTKTKIQPSELSRHEIAKGNQCTAFNLKRATRVVQSLFDDAFKPIGLEGTQYTVLSHIYVSEPISLTKLADLMDVDRTTVARNLAPLEKRGLVEIKPGSDRRAKLINTTEQGKEILTKALPLWTETQEKIKGTLGVENWSSMISSLKGLVEDLKET